MKAGKKTAALILASAMLLGAALWTGYQRSLDTGSPDGAARTLYKTLPQPVSLTELVLAEGISGENTVRLIMESGTYFDSDNAPPGGGIGEDNYQGDFRLEVQKDGKPVSSLELGSLLFNGTFSLVFDDYNDDGSPDFSVGQWAGSNYNAFSLYSLDKDGQLSSLGEIMTSEGKGENDGSLLFSHKNGVISTRLYDQNTGKMTDVSYVWNSGENRFGRES